MLSLSVDSWILWQSFRQYWLALDLVVLFVLYLAILRATRFQADRFLLKLIMSSLFALMTGFIFGRLSSKQSALHFLPNIARTEWCDTRISISLLWMQMLAGHQRTCEEGWQTER